MTARFALYLNPDAIMLAERQGEGWKFRGQADPADPGFAGQLALLRAAAAGDGEKAETLLVLPDDQIRVERLALAGDAPDPAEEVPGLLAETLGLSPQDLGLDWQRSNDTITAALVARQTLTEAEGFARAHGFTPAGAVARSDLAGFTGSPWFGTADGLTERPADLPAIGPLARETPATAIFTSSIAAERRVGSVAPPKPSIDTPADPVPGKQLESPAFSARERARIAASLVPYDLDPDEFPEERENTRRPAARPRATPGPTRRNVARFGLVLTLVLIAVMAGAAFLFGGKGSDDHVILLPDAAPTPQAPLANPPMAALPPAGPATAPGAEKTADAAPTVTLPPLADAFGPAPDAAMPVTNGTLPDFAEARDVFVPSSALVDRAERTPVDVVEQPGIDPETGTDALALAPEAGPEAETAPAALPSPPPPGRQFELGEDGLVKATKEGVTTPDGVLVFAGHPPVTPQQRALPDPQGFAAPAEGAADDPLRKLRPRTRPEGLVDNHQRAQLGGHTLDELAQLRPNSRPDAVEEAAARLNTASDLAVASVARPGARPEDLAIRVPDLSSAATAAVAAALAPQSQAPAPQPAAVQPAAPRAPAPQPVAPQATTRTAAVAAPSTAPARGSEFSMSKVSLLGTFGHSSKPRALVRMPNGRVMNLEVGDRIDGGRVAAIRAGELYYSKGGKNHVLLMPKG